MLKINQLFCSHKERHLLYRVVMHKIFRLPFYDIYEIYECDKCGKVFRRKC